MNRVFKGSIALMPFLAGGAGLSFVAFNFSVERNDVCNADLCDSAIGLKSREGPFVSFRNVSMGKVLFDTVKISESYKNGNLARYGLPDSYYKYMEEYKNK